MVGSPICVNSCRHQGLGWFWKNIRILSERVSLFLLTWGWRKSAFSLNVRLTTQEMSPTPIHTQCFIFQLTQWRVLSLFKLQRHLNRDTCSTVWAWLDREKTHVDKSFWEDTGVSRSFLGKNRYFLTPRTMAGLFVYLLACSDSASLCDIGWLWTEDNPTVSLSKVSNFSHLSKLQ